MVTIPPKPTGWDVLVPPQCSDYHWWEPGIHPVHKVIIAASDIVPVTLQRREAIDTFVGTKHNEGIV